jgi:hypothetical protein
MCKVCQRNSGVISRRSLGLFAISSAGLFVASTAGAKEKKSPPKSATPILSATVDEKRLKVVGGIYRLQNGDVEMVA